MAEHFVAEEQLRAPFEYIRKLPGKHIRSRLAEAFNQWLCIDEKILTKIMNIVEMLHNASLMIDDIEDSSVLRRGAPAAHIVYGTPRTINTANYIYMAALHECLEMGKVEAVEIYTTEMMELHKGQGKEIYWRDTVQCPTEEEYKNMVLQKTGGLFFLAVRLMELYSSKKYNFTSILQKLALYFQIRDDYINLCSSRYGKEKGFAEDITEGKFSLPIILALRHDTQSAEAHQDDELLNILRQRPTNDELKKYFIQVMHERGSFKKTIDRLQQYYNEVVREVANLDGNDKLIKIMDYLHNSVHAAAVEETKLFS